MKTLFKHILDNIVYLTAFSFFISKSKIPFKILSKEKFDKKEKMFLILIFSFASIMGTYVGIDYNGAIANTRNIGVVVGSLIGGPIVGFFIGLFAGLHRVLIDIHGITSIPCGVATFLGGIISGYCSKFVLRYNSKLIAGILGIIVENMSMIFIVIFSRPHELALNIVKNIYVPMVFLNAAGIVIILILLEDIVKEQEKEAGKQIKLAMDIAIETLPYFRNFGEESLQKVSSIIRKGIGAQLVVITDIEKILASSSQDRRFEVYHSNIKSEYTKKVIESGEILESRYEIDNKDLVYNNKEIKSAIIAPLKTNNSVQGTLKIYFSRKNSINERNRHLIEGLSHLISTQMEISRISVLTEMANKSEIKALQAQISPHFLFNTLNAISSFIRFDAQKARDLILDLSTYLRCNIDMNEEEITIGEELKRCRAYSNIELARFSDSLEVIYLVEDKALDIKIPSFSIQPLVENAIKHGALKNKDIGKVEVKIEKEKNSYRISVRDNGSGIVKEQIMELIRGEKVNGRIGLYNVNKRLNLILGKGLEIDTKLGTEISFYVRGDEE